MFAEYLKDHPLEGLLASDAAPLFPPAKDRGAWEGIPEEHRREIDRLARAYADRPYPMRPATAFLDFVRTGSRAADETPYFFRRRKLCAAALSTCLHPDDGVDGVIDGLWCLCEETSWVISAHNVNPIPGAPAAREYPLPDPEKPYIDLFSAQTGMILALTRHLLKDQLDKETPLLCRRIEREIEKRVLTPFQETDEFWWMGVKRRDLNNWTPWILSNVILCACLLPMEMGRRAALLERACVMLDRWLGVVPADGGCDEGAGYWNMAGGALLDCLETLSCVTGGRMTFWQDEKLRNLLSFPAKMELGGGWFVNFADCDARPLLSGERLQYAGEALGDPALIAMGNRLRGTLEDQIRDTPHFSRVLRLLFHGPAAEKGAPAGDVWLPDLQWRVVRRGGMALCCKGGHNGESHNHNDVGSFMLYLDGDPQIVDAGNMTYTAKTFSDQRYTLWNVRAAYHNVPLIGGMEQCPGAAFAAREVKCLPDGMALDMAGAYGPEGEVNALRREMRLTDEGLTIRDEIHLNAPKEITWVFMLRNRPEIRQDAVTAGGVALDLPAGVKAAAEEIPVTDARMQKSFPGSLWRLLLTAEKTKDILAVFRIGRNKEHA